MADVTIRLLGNVLHGGLIRRVDDELELAEDLAEHLVAEGKAELVKGKAASSKTK